jgi:hypothetical protein
MPSIEHEAVVEILHRDPQLAAMLVGRAGISLPSGATAVVADSNLSARDPSVLIADKVQLWQGIDRKVAVITEVQKTRPDPSRSLAWPAYICNARVEHECDVILLVFALTEAIARASAKTIRTGHPGFDLTPLISGHGRLPPPGGPFFGPQLTVLNILTGDLDLTTHEARMFALVSIAEAPAELREGYTRLIRAIVPDSARAALEELLKTVIKDPFIDDFIEKGLAQGRAEGRAQGEAQLLLRYLDARFDVPEGVRDEVTACTDTAQLEAWFDRALTATAIEEVFAPTTE